MFLPEIIIVPQSGSSWTDPAVLASLSASLVALGIAVWGNRKNGQLRESAGREHDSAQAMLIVANAVSDVRTIMEPSEYGGRTWWTELPSWDVWIDIRNVGSQPVLFPQIETNGNQFKVFGWHDEVDGKKGIMQASKSFLVLEPGHVVSFVTDLKEPLDRSDISLVMQLPSGRWVRKTGSNIDFISEPKDDHQAPRGMFT